MDDLKTSGLIFGATTLAFLLDAFVILIPLGRGVLGHGLFTTISEYKALEVALITFAVPYFLGRRLLKEYPVEVVFAAVGLAMLFLALFCFEARWYDFSPEIERRIEGLYGTRTEILTKAGILGAVGLSIYIAAQLSIGIRSSSRARS